MQTVIIGDIHGCDRAFAALLDATRIDPARDTLVLLGDILDRGPNAWGVYQRVVQFSEIMGDRLYCCAAIMKHTGCKRIQPSHRRFCTAAWAGAARSLPSANTARSFPNVRAGSKRIPYFIMSRMRFNARTRAFAWSRSSATIRMCFCTIIPSCGKTGIRAS